MSPAKLITVTLNPSLDRTIKTHFMALGYKNLTHSKALIHPAGRGVSIARAAHQLGANVHAIILLGRGPVGRSYADMLAESDLPHTIVHTTAGTRSNTILYDTGHDQQTELTEERREVLPSELLEVEKAITSIANEGDRVVLGGSLSVGMPLDTYYKLIEAAHGVGAHVALANIGEPLHEAIKAKPELLALTQQEAEGYFNCPVRSVEDVMSVSNMLHQQTGGRVLIHMRDQYKAMLTASSGRWMVEVPEGEEHGTTTGMWAALLAGYMTGRSSEQPFANALGLGAAAAGFTATHFGSEFGSTEEIGEMADDVSVEAIQRRKAMLGPAAL